MATFGSDSVPLGAESCFAGANYGQTAEKVSVPVIASGGAGCLKHIYEAFVEGKASAALLASLLHDGDLSIAEIKNYLLDEGLTIRPLENK